MSNSHAARQIGSPDELATLKKTLLLRFGTDLFVGDSAPYLKSIDRMMAYSKLCAPVLISGETGTGKESIARAMHYLGERADKPFIPVNCGAIPENLLENELFGHERGAYTDASRNYGGLVNEANKGTLFLDEINTLTNAGQVKLLRLLEEQRYKPLGSSIYVEADVRFITATNVRLRDEVHAGRFREDLFYRICLLTVDLPPLRSRGDDVKKIALHYLKQFAQMYDKGEMTFSPDTLETLSLYDWPGNVRELKNLIEKAVVDAQSLIITPHDMELALPIEPETTVFHSMREAKLAMVQEFERGYILKMLEENHWNITKAAQCAKKDRRSFQRLMKMHGIEAEVSRT